jgi:hypothetical protein
MTEESLLEVFNALLQLIGAGIVAGFIVLLFNHRLSIARDKDAKRKQFRSDIELLTRKLEGTLIRDLAFDAAGDFKQIKQLEMFVLDVRPHIRDRKIGKFDDACAAYKNTRFGAIGTLENNAEAEKAKAKLISLLDEIKECAK